MMPLRVASRIGGICVAAMPVTWILVKGSQNLEENLLVDVQEILSHQQAPTQINWSRVVESYVQAQRYPVWDTAFLGQSILDCHDHRAQSVGIGQAGTRK